MSAKSGLIIFGALVGSGLLLFFLLYDWVKIPAGHVGVLVNLYGSTRGVQAEELGVGRYWEGPGEEIYIFPVYERNYVWTQDSQEGSPNDESFTFQTSEGLAINADIGITCTVEHDKVSTLFEKYRLHLDEIVAGPLRNAVRDAINRHAATLTVEEVYSEKKVWLMDTVFKEVAKEFKPKGILVSKISLIGTFRLPQSVLEALNAKITATQRAMQRENELREAEAEARKKIIQAKADAEANEIRQRTITPLLIEQQKLENQRLAIEKWNGVLPQYTGDGGVPL
ncbi:MAG: SPFH domain-containing protein, partial [Bacteroidia bacterium]|nr:SPFH domain-containing protein [Bacteroidia bacterium]MDW8334701.1 SPFH domain-containing protein [Bacteroidia bacterium]